METGETPEAAYARIFANFGNSPMAGMAGSGGLSDISGQLPIYNPAAEPRGLVPEFTGSALAEWQAQAGLPQGSTWNDERNVYITPSGTPQIFPGDPYYLPGFPKLERYAPLGGTSQALTSTPSPTSSLADTTSNPLGTTTPELTTPDLTTPDPTGIKPDMPGSLTDSLGGSGFGDTIGDAGMMRNLIAQLLANRGGGGGWGGGTSVGGLFGGSSGLGGKLGL